MRYPAPGKMVDVGGYRMHLLARGKHLVALSLSMNPIIELGSIGQRKPVQETAQLLRSSCSIVRRVFCAAPRG